MVKAAAVPGTHSAGKALALLRLVARHHPEGLRLTDAIALSGLDRSTVHRQLACLVEEGFVDRASDSKRYRLGIESMQLGLNSGAMAPLVQRFRPVVQAMACESGDTVFLVVRSGDHALCLHREDRVQPEHTLVVAPGIRRVLGASAVGVGVLAQWSDGDIEATYQRHLPAYRKAGLSFGGLSERIQATRDLGYSQVSDPRTVEARGVGCALRLSVTSFAGVSVAAPNARMPIARQRELGGALVAAMRSLRHDMAC